MGCPVLDDGISYLCGYGVMRGWSKSRIGAGPAAKVSAAAGEFCWLPGAKNSKRLWPPPNSITSIPSDPPTNTFIRVIQQLR